MDYLRMMSAQNIFDCMAIAFYYIEGMNGQKLQSIRRRYKPDQYSGIASIIRMYVSEPGNILFQFKALIRDIVNFFEQQSDRECSCYALIEAIDRYVLYNKCTGLVFFNSTRRIQTLSEHVPEIIILPRNQESYIADMNKKLKAFEVSKGKKAYGFRDRHKENSEINTDLNNYDIYHVKSIPKTVELIQFDHDQLYGDISHLRENLRFGVFPLINQDKLQLFEREDSPLTFAIKNIKIHHETTIRQRCMLALHSSINTHVDIAIFPELLLTEQIIGEMLTEIRKIEPKTLPRLMVLGSVWQNRTNRSIVVSNAGDIVMEHFKQHPYKFGTLIEDLSLENTKIQFMDYPIIGRIFTYICNDLNSEKMLEVVERFGGDLLLLPSFSPSLDLKTKAEDLAKSYVCSTVMCNTCSALKMDRVNWTNCEGKAVGFISIPGKMNTSNWCKTETYKTCDVCCQCKVNSCGWLITLHLDQLEQDVSQVVANKISIDPIF